MLLEPVTSLTDVLLTVLAGGLAWYLNRNAPRPLTRRDAYWVNSFTTLAAATALGAVIHGIPLGFAYEPVWIAIRLWTTISEVFFFLGALSSVFDDRTARRLTPGVLAVFGLLLVVLVVTHDYFMLFEALGIGAATVLYALHYAAMGQPRSLALPGAALFFGVGTALQAEQAQIDLIWTFNGNDIFHLALMGALVCIAAGAHPSLAPLDSSDLARLPRPPRLPLSARNRPRGPFTRS